MAAPPPAIRFTPEKTYRCTWCSASFFGGDPQLTTERILPREQCKSGWFPNLLVVCAACSEVRDGRSVARWMLACQAAGMDVRYTKVCGKLRNLVRRSAGSEAARQELAQLGVTSVANDGPLHTQPALPHAQEQMRRLVKRDGRNCVWCGCTLDWHDRKASREHVLPACRSHCNQDANLVLACRTCNNGRNDRPVAEWIKICHHKGLQPRLKVLAQSLIATGHLLDESLPTLSPYALANRQQLLSERDAGLAAIEGLCQPSTPPTDANMSPSVLAAVLS